MNFNEIIIEKNMPLPTFLQVYCSYQLKSTLVTVKHQQHLFLFYTNYNFRGR